MLSYAGTIGANSGDVIYVSKQDLNDYPEHIIQETNGGALSVEVTLDGSTWTAVAVDIMSAAPVTQAMTIGANEVGRLRMRVKGVRVLQSGATASDATILHSEGS